MMGLGLEAGGAAGEHEQEQEQAPPSPAEAQAAADRRKATLLAEATEVRGYRYLPLSAMALVLTL